jgi:hypothetical protein
MPEDEHKEIFKEQLHEEHVIDIGRSDLKNCIPSCKSCNSKKHKSTLNQFYNETNPDYTYDRYYKIYQWLIFDYKNFIKPKRQKRKYNNEQ